MKKICKKCLIEKKVENFGNDKNKKDGKKIYCKQCELLRGREYRKKNRDKVNNSSKNYRINNPEKYKNSIKKYLEKNPNMTSKERSKNYRKTEEGKNKIKQYRKKYYQKNLDKLRTKRKEYYHENKEKNRLLNNKWKSKKRKEDGFYRLKINLRDRIRDYLKGDIKSKRTNDIVGLDKVEFKLYIESKFTEGMSWENYGKWHLDHIKPLCEAKNYEEVLILNHYTNLQPLWAEDNLRKNRKL
jgi:hypothetical protein